jgi:hypothetical protein
MGLTRKRKKELSSKIDELDKKAEHAMLLPHEVDLRHCLKVQLIQLLLEEEIKWYQRSKLDNLLQGDNNTKYFHLVANGKHRKTHIFQLEDSGQIIREQNHLESYITEFYKGLFDLSKGEHFSPDESRY